MKLILSFLFSFTLLTTSAQQSFEEQLDLLSQTISQKLSEKNIKKIAVSEFIELSGDSSLLGKYISDEFGIGLTIHSTNFEVVERARLGVLLKEQKLSSESLFNDSTRIQLGNIYGVEALLFGTITTFENDMRLTVRVINTETGALINAQAVNITYNERIKSLLNIKKNAVTSFETEKKQIEKEAPVKIVDNRPKCERENLGNVTIWNKGISYHTIKVSPENSQSASSTIEVPPFDKRTYFELPVGVQKLKISFVNPNGYTVVRTEIIQVNIEQCKTVEFIVK